MEDDILDVLDSNEKAFADTNSSNNNSATINKYEEKDTFDYWNNADVPPMKIDVEKLKSTAKRFTICVFNKYKELDEETTNKFIAIAKSLSNKGYIFRHTGHANDKLQNKILEIDGIKVESFIPYKKFNTNIERPKLYKPKGTAFKIAANSHKGFKNLKPGLRTILARDVHALLGPDCTDPSTLLIGYSPDGAEALVRGLDFAETGNLAFYLKVAGDSNIPVFNLKKEDAIKRLSEFLKTIN